MGRFGVWALRACWNMWALMQPPHPPAPPPEGERVVARAFGSLQRVSHSNCWFSPWNPELHGLCHSLRAGLAAPLCSRGATEHIDCNQQMKNGPAKTGIVLRNNALFRPIVEGLLGDQDTSKDQATGTQGDRTRSGGRVIG